jgi:hypothetical protein
MIVFLVFLALLVLAVCYVIYVRPFLEQRDWVRPLPGAASDMRSRLKIAVRGSLTMVWMWLVGLFGAAMLLLDGLSILFADPKIKTQVMAVLPPSAVPWVIITIAVVGALARLRTARKGG